MSGSGLENNKKLHELRGINKPGGTSWGIVYEAPLKWSVVPQLKLEVNKCPLKRPKIVKEDIKFADVRAAIAVEYIR
jgi:hypothetical protein